MPAVKRSKPPKKLPAAATGGPPAMCPQILRLSLGECGGRDAGLRGGVFVFAERILQLVGALVEALVPVGGQVAAPSWRRRQQHDSLRCGLVGHVRELVPHAVELGGQLTLPFYKRHSFLSWAQRFARGLQNFGWVLNYSGRHAVLLRRVLKIADLLHDFLPAQL